jgi:hypothetical protein
MSASITVTIKADGSVQYEANGIKGKTCKDLTAFLAKGLAGTASEKLKSEYYQTATITQTQGA